MLLQSSFVNRIKQKLVFSIPCYAINYGTSIVCITEMVYLVHAIKRREIVNTFCLTIKRNPYWDYI